MALRKLLISHKLSLLVSYSSQFSQELVELGIGLDANFLLTTINSSFLPSNLNPLREDTTLV